MSAVRNITVAAVMVAEDSTITFDAAAGPPMIGREDGATSSSLATEGVTQTHLTKFHMGFR